MMEQNVDKAREAVRARFEVFGEKLEEEERKAKAIKDAAFALAGVFGAFLLMKRLGKDLRQIAESSEAEASQRRRRRSSKKKRRARRVSR